MTTKLHTIDHDLLVTVSGGAGPERAGYNAEDLAQGALWGAAGAATGGPVGGAVGFGAGFMSRNVGNLGRAIGDLWGERQRGQQLDRQLQQLNQRRANGGR